MPRASRVNEENIEEHAVQPTKQNHARMVDWIRCFKLPVMLASLGSLVIYATIISPDLAKNTAGFLLIAMLLIGIGLSALLTQLKGTFFNKSKDSLSYPLTMCHRNVRLSEIHAANRCRPESGWNSLRRIHRVT